MSSAAADSEPISTAASSISQNRRAGIPRNDIGVNIVVFAGGAAGAGVAAAPATRSNVYQSAYPPSYSDATNCVPSVEDDSAKSYSKRSASHAVPAVGSLNNEAYHVRHACTTPNTVAAASVGIAGVAGSALTARRSAYNLTPSIVRPATTLAIVSASPVCELIGYAARYAAAIVGATFACASIRANCKPASAACRTSPLAAAGRTVSRSTTAQAGSIRHTPQPLRCRSRTDRAPSCSVRTMPKSVGRRRARRTRRPAIAGTRATTGRARARRALRTDHPSVRGVRCGSTS